MYLSTIIDICSAGFPARTAYLPEPMAENHYENISFDASDADASPWARGNRSRASRMSAGPAVPPRHTRKTREQDEEEEAVKSESDTYGEDWRQGVTVGSDINLQLT